MLDAQRDLCAAEDAQAQSETNAMVTLIAVNKALGGDWAPDGPMSPTPDGAQMARQGSGSSK